MYSKIQMALNLAYVPLVLLCCSTCGNMYFKVIYNCPDLRYGFELLNQPNFHYTCTCIP